MSHMEGNYEPHAQNALASSRGIMSHIEWIGCPAWLDFLPCTRTESSHFNRMEVVVSIGCVVAFQSDALSRFNPLKLSLRF